MKPPRSAVLVLVVVLAIGVGAVTRVSSGSPGSSARSAVQPAKGWCEARPNAAWRSALVRGVVGLSRKASIVPLAADDGRSFFATIYSPSFSGVARINAQTSQVTRIKGFPDPSKDQVWGSFDGRWLLWFEGHSFSNLGDFTVFAWDSRTARLVKIGAGSQDPRGRFRLSQWRYPYVRNGVATWEQASGPNGPGDVHVFDLATRHDRIVRHGYTGSPVLVGDHLVVWPESVRLHGSTRMRAADVQTGRPTAVPVALRGLHGISAAAFITDGSAIVYPTDDYGSLSWSPSLSVAPIQLVTAGGDHVDNSLQVAGRYVFFSVAPHAYLADTVTRRYIQVSGGGWGRLNERAFVLLPPSGRKANHVITDVLLFPIASLPPMPRCR